MRSSDEPTLADFESALEHALRRELVSDTGMPEAVEDALDAVREAAPNPPQALIDAARAAFLRS